jgi:phage FluMu protein Com
MPIEMRCTGCGQTLRVADEHAGKKARCPSCGTIAEVPSPGSPVETAPPPAPPSSPSSSPFAPDYQPTAAANPFADKPDVAPNPYATPGGFNVTPRSHSKAHRGGTVLALGIAGLVCCQPLGIAAWVMGNSDLKEIRRGVMDPSGQGLTQAGMIIGIIATVWFALAVLFYGFMFVAAMVGNL